MAYGGTGRYPHIINTTVKGTKYWLILCKLPTDRIPKQAYLMMSRMNVPDEMNWTKSVETSLYKMGFGYVRKNGDVTNEASFFF